MCVLRNAIFGICITIGATQIASAETVDTFPAGYTGWKSVSHECNANDTTLTVVGYRDVLGHEQVTEYHKGETLLGTFMNSPPYSTLYSIPAYNNGAFGYFGIFDDPETQDVARAAFIHAVHSDESVAKNILSECEATEAQVGQELFDQLFASAEVSFPDYINWEMRERQCDDRIIIRVYGTNDFRHVFEARLAHDRDRIIFAYTKYPAPETLMLIQVDGNVSLHERSTGTPQTLLINAIANALHTNLDMPSEKEFVSNLNDTCAMSMMSAGMELDQKFREDRAIVDGEFTKGHLDDE